MDKPIIKPSIVRAIARAHGKRVSQAFIDQLDAFVRAKVSTCCQEHNGGRKTLDLGIAHYHLGRR